jgi:hypothetical protein
MTSPEVVSVGETLRVAEADYTFGLGPLTLRVTAVVGIEQYHDEPWVNLRGIELGPGGREGVERPAQVRVAALPAARRAAQQTR